MNETPQPLRVRATTTSGPPRDRAAGPDGSPSWSWPSISWVGTPNARNFSASGLEIGDLPRRAEALKAVEVDQERQVVEPVVPGEDQGLPARALVPLAVGRQAVDAARLPFEPLRQGQPGRQTRPVPEAAGGEQDVVDPRRRRVAAQPRVVLVELPEVVVRQPAQRPERDVVGPGRVPLGEDELVVTAAGPRDGGPASSRGTRGCRRYGRRRSHSASAAVAKTPAAADRPTMTWTGCAWMIPRILII